MRKAALVIYQKDGVITVTGEKPYKKEYSAEEDVTLLAGEIEASLREERLVEESDVIVCPGGVLKPVKKGCYQISGEALRDARENIYGKHAYNKLTELACEVGRKCGLPAIMMYPMSSDELLPINRITSHADIPKYSRYHALEHHFGQIILGNLLKKRVENMNCIVAYMDDFVSVSACERGVCLDVNDCIGLEGPMGLTSSGDVPVAQIAAYFMENQYSYSDMEEMLGNSAGLRQYTGVSNIQEMDLAYGRDEAVKTACEAMAYQVAKWIGSSALVLKGKVDGILLSGRAAESKILPGLVKKRVENIAPVFIVQDMSIEKYMAEEAGMLGTYACPVYTY